MIEERIARVEEARLDERPDARQRRAADKWHKLLTVNLSKKKVGRGEEKEIFWEGRKEGGGGGTHTNAVEDGCTELPVGFVDEC